MSSDLEALLKGSFNDKESIKACVNALKHGKVGQVKRWINEPDKLVLSEELGDAVMHYNSDLALLIYLRAQVNGKIIQTYTSTGLFEKIAKKSEDLIFSIDDYLSLLTSILNSETYYDHGPVLAEKLSDIKDRKTGKPLMKLDSLADVFKETNKLEQYVQFLLPILELDMAAHAEMQTTFFQVYFLYNSDAAMSELNSFKLSHFDREQIAEFCEKNNLVKSALSLFMGSPSDIYRILATPHALQLLKDNYDWFKNYMLPLGASDTSVRCLKSLLSVAETKEDRQLLGKLIADTFREELFKRVNIEYVIELGLMNEVLDAISDDNKFPVLLSLNDKETWMSHLKPGLSKENLDTLKTFKGNIEQIATLGNILTSEKSFSDDLIPVLEALVFESNFKNSTNLQNLLLITAIKQNNGKVKEYVRFLDNFDDRIAELAETHEMYEEAYAIYHKFGFNESAMKILLERLEDTERARLFAIECNDENLLRMIPGEESSNIEEVKLASGGLDMLNNSPDSLNSEGSIQACLYALKNGNSNLVMEWLEEPRKLVYTEVLGDAVKQYDEDMALLIYLRCHVPEKVIQAYGETGQFHKIAKQNQEIIYSKDEYLYLLKCVLENDRTLKQGPPLAETYTELKDSNGREGFIDVESIVKVFEETNRIEQCIEFLGPILDSNMEEQAALQTKYFELYLNYDMARAFVEYSKNKLTHFDKERIGHVCASLGQLKPALELFSESESNAIRAFASREAVELMKEDYHWVKEYLSKFEVMQDSFMCLKNLALYCETDEERKMLAKLFIDIFGQMFGFQQFVDCVMQLELNDYITMALPEQQRFPFLLRLRDRDTWVHFAKPEYVDEHFEILKTFNGEEDSLIVFADVIASDKALKDRLFPILEALVFESTFKDSTMLQNILLKHAIKENGRVMEYLESLHGYDSEIASVAESQGLYEEAFYVYRKIGQNEEAMRILIDKIGDSVRARKFANEHKDQKLMQMLQARKSTSEGDNFSAEESITKCVNALKKGDDELVMNWFSELGKLVFTEALGDAILPINGDIALAAYIRAEIPKKVLKTYAETKQFEKISNKPQSLFYSKEDYLYLLKCILSNEETYKQAPELGVKLEQIKDSSNEKLIDLDSFIEVFEETNRLGQCIDFLRPVLILSRADRDFKSVMQTKFFEIYFRHNPDDAKAELDMNRLTLFDRDRIAQFCEENGHALAALDLYIDNPENVYRVLATPEAMKLLREEYDWVKTYISAFEGMQISTKCLQSLATVAQTDKDRKMLAKLLIEMFRHMVGLPFFADFINELNMSEEVMTALPDHNKFDYMLLLNDKEMIKQFLKPGFSNQYRDKLASFEGDGNLIATFIDVLTSDDTFADDLIPVLEALTLESKFKDFSNLHNRLMSAAILRNEKVMDYAVKLNGYDDSELGELAENHGLYEEAVIIYHKCGKDELALRILLNKLGDIERAKQFAIECNDETLLRMVPGEEKSVIKPKPTPADSDDVLLPALSPKSTGVVTMTKKRKLPPIRSNRTLATTAGPTVGPVRPPPPPPQDKIYGSKSNSAPNAVPAPRPRLPRKPVLKAIVPPNSHRLPEVGGKIGQKKNSRQLVIQMNSDDVNRWLADNGLDQYSEKFAKYNGQMLDNLYSLHSTAPEFFCQSLSSKLDGDFDNVITFFGALSKLYGE